jgi:hypothetical protein
MDIRGKFHAPAAFPSEKEFERIKCIGGWVIPRASGRFREEETLDPACYVNRIPQMLCIVIHLVSPLGSQNDHSYFVHLKFRLKIA